MRKDHCGGQRIDRYGAAWRDYFLGSEAAEADIGLPRRRFAPVAAESSAAVSEASRDTTSWCGRSLTDDHWRCPSGDPLYPLARTGPVVPAHSGNDRERKLMSGKV